MKKIINMFIMILVISSNSAFSETNYSKEFIEKNNAIIAFNNPESNESEIAKSILIFEKYSKQDDTMLYYLGKANYEKSITLLTLNKNLGRQYIEKAAVMGNNLAEYDYAMILFKENKKTEAINYLKNASSRNNAKAQYALGKMYYLGDRVPRSKKNGFTLINAAAQNNDANAQYDLAKIYFSQKDEKIQKGGVTWLQKAVINGNYDACDDLYKLYLAGILVNIDYNRHVEYLKCSAVNNNNDAKYLLATYYAKGKYVPRDVHQSAYWLKSLAEDKDSDASVQYSNYIFTFFPTNKIKVFGAIGYLENVSNINVDAAMILGSIYKDGLYNIPKDRGKAIKFYESAKNQGNSDAQYRILELLNP